MDITKIAYEKYRLDWMIRHGYTLSDLMNCLLEEQERDSRAHVNTLFSRWEENGSGFNRSLWKDYEDFIETDFWDDAYMGILLNDKEFYLYKRWFTEHQE